MAIRDRYEYLGVPVIDAPDVHDENPILADVLTAFRDVRTKGDYMAAWDGNLIREPRYRQTKDNRYGLYNHFQGIQRLGAGQYMVISGGDPHETPGATPEERTRQTPRSHLFIFEMGSRQAAGGWRSNLVDDGVPPDQDTMIGVIGIDREHHHAGGLSALGDILAVPIESETRSKIVFYNMADPTAPTRFPATVEIDRPPTAAVPSVKTGAVTLAKISDGRILVAAWSDSDADDPRLEFYVSRTDSISDGFHPKGATWYADSVWAVEGQDDNFSNFQAVAFVADQGARDDATEGKDGLCLIGTHNTARLGPLQPGRDYADLYLVEFDQPGADGSIPNASVSVTKVANKHLYCNDEQAHFDAAGGIHVERPDGLDGFLRIYGAYYSRDARNPALIRFNEYRSPLDRQGDTITRLQDGWVEIFEDSRFRGRYLSMRGHMAADTYLPDYRRVSVQSDSFNNKASSVRFQLPATRQYTLYEEERFSTKGYEVDLRGTGGVVEIRNLADQGHGDGISSSRYTPI